MQLKYNKPAIFEKTDCNIWTDPYIQHQMLKEHLNTESDGASRRKESVEKIIDFILPHLTPESRLLDLGCGPGLFTSIFQEKGYSVTGIDFNKASIEYARNTNKEVSYIEGDYIENYPDDTFHAVIMIYCDLGTHSDNDRDKLLGNIYNSLEKDGVFIFDVFTEALAADRHEGKSWEYAPAGGFWDAGEYLLLSETFHYPQYKAFAYQYNLIANHEPKHFIVWDRFYSEDEINLVMQNAGFREITIHKNILDCNNFTSNSEMFIVAKK